MDGGGSWRAIVVPPLPPAALPFLQPSGQGRAALISRLSGETTCCRNKMSHSVRYRGTCFIAWNAWAGSGCEGRGHANLTGLLPEPPTDSIQVPGKIHGRR